MLDLTKLWTPCVLLKAELKPVNPKLLFGTEAEATLGGQAIAVRADAILAYTWEVRGDNAGLEPKLRLLAYNCGRSWDECKAAALEYAARDTRRCTERLAEAQAVFDKINAWTK